MRNTQPLRRWISTLMLLSLAACASTAPPPPTPPSPLFDRLGGMVGVSAVIDDFMGTVVADKRIAAYFRKTDLGHFKAALRDQICAASGGPCTYNGKPMLAAHRGRGVTQQAFDALIEDMQKTLDKAHFAAQDQAELLAILYAMKEAIVQPEPPARPAAAVNPKSAPSAIKPSSKEKTDRKGRSSGAA